ncbi:hypothetical protein [Caudoviricetes sp.]|nr:hypothetical protein [Caudoviricetes sp.]
MQDRKYSHKVVKDRINHLREEEADKEITEYLKHENKD